MIPKYLYVKNWEYAHPLLKEVFQGLPQVNKIYKADFNPQTNQYYLTLVENKDRVLIPNLINNNEEDGFTCELVELSKTNLLDLNLDEEELDKIISWNQTMIPQQNIQAVIQHGFEQMQQERAERIAWGNEALCGLDNVNSTHFEVIVNLAELLEEKNIIEHDNITDLALDPSYGAGINISRAQEALQRYVSSDRRTNENPIDLYEALYNIIVELERRDINGLDE